MLNWAKNFNSLLVDHVASYQLTFTLRRLVSSYSYMFLFKYSSSHLIAYILAYS